MPSASPFLRCCICSASLLASGLAATDLQADTQLSAAATLGLEYDSNVAIDEIDRNSNVGDSSSFYGLSGRLTQKLSSSDSMSVSYDYSLNRYNDFDFLDRKTKILGLDYKHDFEKVSASVNYFDIKTSLGGKDFLGYRRLSPYITGFLSKRFFARAAYIHGEKEIQQLEGRNALTDGLELDTYYFWRGLRRYVNVGYSYREEDADDAQFSYKSQLLKLRFVQRFNLRQTTLTLDTGIRYETRDYEADAALIEERREDNRTRLTMNLAIPLKEHLTWKLLINLGNYSSNLPTADYDQAVIGSQIELAL